MEVDEIIVAKCKPEVKKKWLEALRSEEYAQERECLRGELGFCCLGVLVDLHTKENPDIKWVKDEGYFIVEGEGAVQSTFPLKVTNTWASETETSELTVKEWEILSTMNDSENKSFKTIANFIEENL